MITVSPTQFFITSVGSRYDLATVDLVLLDLQQKLSDPNLVLLPGYRDGVVYIKLPNIYGILSSVIQLTPNTKLVAEYVSRVPSEDPRKHVAAVVHAEDLHLAKNLFIVLYSKQVLAEDNDIITTDYGIVSLLTSNTDFVEPMSPQTLMYNHFHQSGGTSTGMTSEEFEEALKESFLFWKDRAILSKEEY